MKATVLYPLRQIPESETNASSYVLKITFGSDCAILTGDAPESIENFLVDMYKEELQCPLLKAGHHGSRTSTSERFLKAVNPSWVVISAGKNNSYGHPHREVVDRVTSHKATLLETSKLGTIRFFIREGKLVLDK
jgi:beta-lactamase superfamily II metal-dependent hydrolase